MARPGLSLVGFMDEATAIPYLMSTCFWDENTPELAHHRWNEAKDRLRPMPGVHGVPDVQSIPEEHAAYLQSVTQYPRFAASVEGMPAAFQLVEIDPIICFQQHVLADISDNITQAYRSSGNLQGMLEQCLPAQPRSIPAAISEQVGEVAITSKDLNLRLLGPVGGVQPENGAQLSGFAWGGSFPMVQVVRFQGRYFLKNGYHRTVSFRRLGVTHIPCLLLEATHFAQTGATGSGFFTWDVLSADMPPTVGHLASDMAYPVQLREFMRVIRITASQSEVPLDI